MPSRVSALAVGLALLAILGGTTSAAGRPLSPPWQATTPFSSETAVVTLDGHVVDAEIADTARLRERGLSYRDALEPDTGMIFLYDESTVRSFWMFEMRFCLDIVWINDGRIVGAAENACPAEDPGDEIPRFRSPEAVQFVLEVDAGWMARNEVAAGSVVEIELPPGAGREP